MGGVYDDVEIEDLTWSVEDKTFYYPCPCGDKFYITLVRSLTATLHSGAFPLLTSATFTDLTCRRN